MGEVPLPSPLPPGLDDFLVDEGAILGCIGLPRGDVDIDLRPPILGEMMFEELGLEEWIILPFLVVAVAIIIWFLKRKIQRKFDEIELRHQFEARRKRQQRLLLESE